MYKVKKLYTVEDYINVYTYRNESNNLLKYGIGAYSKKTNSIIFVTVERENIGFTARYLRRKVKNKYPWQLRVQKGNALESILLDASRKYHILAEMRAEDVNYGIEVEDLDCIEEDIFTEANGFTLLFEEGFVHNINNIIRQREELSIEIFGDRYPPAFEEWVRGRDIWR